jgi:TPP-dependent pyruvate/acetoin dehydrogenase alpha subunit
MISVLPDSLPVAVGVALAFRIRREPRVAMTWLGEGGTSTGAFHEALNLAAVMRLPVVVVCENNQWALSTPVGEEVGAPRVADRALSYGIPGQQVDGNDVEAVYAVAEAAVERARAGGGPTFIEAVTMRMRGHSIIDPADYVPREQLAEWEARDPIRRYRERLEADGIWDAARQAELESELKVAVEAAIERAAALPDPEPGWAHEGVFEPGPASSAGGPVG